MWGRAPALNCNRKWTWTFGESHRGSLHRFEGIYSPICIEWLLRKKFSNYMLVWIWIQEPLDTESLFLPIHPISFVVFRVLGWQILTQRMIQSSLMEIISTPCWMCRFKPLWIKTVRIQWIVICWSLPVQPRFAEWDPVFLAFTIHWFFQCFGKSQGRLVAYPFVGKTDPSMWMFPSQLLACSTSMVVER